MENELYHYGRKGMKWYEHIFTSGRNRYGTYEGIEAREEKKRRRREAVDKAFEPSFKGGKDKPNVSAVERISKETGSITNNISRILDSRDIMREAGKGKQSNASTMSDQELRDAINRLELERKYDSLSQSTVSKGKVYTDEILKTVGSVVGIVGSVAGIISTINTIRKG